MIVYITTNLINGKKYIGKDERNSPKYLGSGNLLRAAIKKYGRENFQKEILAYARDRADLCELEKYYIDYYSAIKSDLFYNIAEGGFGGRTVQKWQYREVKVLQLDPDTFDIIKRYDSAKEAALDNKVNYKVLSKVINGNSRSVSGKLFVKEEGFNKEKFVEDYIPKMSRYAYTVNGRRYYKKDDIWRECYSDKLALSSFRCYTHLGLIKLEKEKL